MCVDTNDALLYTGNMKLGGILLSSQGGLAYHATEEVLRVLL